MANTFDRNDEQHKPQQATAANTEQPRMKQEQGMTMVIGHDSGEQGATSAPSRSHIMLMFCKVITAQVDYIIALYKDNYMMREKEILCKRVASPSPAISHLGMYALTHV